MTPSALFWHLIETKYSLKINHKDLLTRHSIGCLVWKETPLSAHLVDSLWLLEPVGCDRFLHSRQTHKHKSRIRAPFLASPAGNSQIPDPVNIFIVFPIPAQYFGQILNPENTLPDPVSWPLTWHANYLLLLEMCGISLGYQKSIDSVDNKNNKTGGFFRFRAPCIRRC